MSKTKLTDAEKLILEKVKGYYDNQIKLYSYETQLKDLGNNSNSIAQYGKEYIRVTTMGSKIESHILKKERLNEKIIELEKEILEVENAKNKLGTNQKKVIEELMRGKKMTNIADSMGRSKQQIYKFRKNALRNMVIFLNN